MADQNKSCTITNNSGKNIVVALTISDDETASQDAVIAVNHQVEILKTPAGNTIIKNGSSDTVTLDHNYKPGSDETGYVQDYNLIVSDSTWLYPLADIPLVQQGANGSASYAPQTVDATNQAAMSQAFDLYQTIAAYPSSQLATDYLTTLKQAQDAALACADSSAGSAKAAADTIDNTMDSFFKGTDQYKDVSLADIVAVDNYYNNFPCVWAQYRDSITYYLYGTDGTTAFFSGTLSLENAGMVDITKANSGYTCSFAPAIDSSDTGKTSVDATKSVNLTYSKGLFLDDISADAPKISLKGNFMLGRLFTNDPDDNNVIPVLTGTVNGITCIGFDMPQTSGTPLQTNITTASTSSPAEKYWDTLIHPKDQQELIVSILTLVGAISLIPATAFAIYGIYRFVKYKQQMNEAIALDKIVSRRQKVMRDWDPDRTYVYTPPTAEKINELRAKADVAANIKKSIGLKFDLNRQNTSLQEALKYSAQLDTDIVTLIQHSLGTIRDISKKLAIRNEDLGSVLPDAYNSFSMVIDNMKQINTAVNQHLTEEERVRMKWTISDSAGTFERFESSIQKEEKEVSDLNPDLEKKIIPEEVSVG